MQVSNLLWRNLLGIFDRIEVLRISRTTSTSRETGYLTTAAFEVVPRHKQGGHSVSSKGRTGYDTELDCFEVVGLCGIDALVFEYGELVFSDLR